jgi:hypothetical protein
MAKKKMPPKCRTDLLGEIMDWMIWGRTSCRHNILSTLKAAFPLMTTIFMFLKRSHEMDLNYL